MFVFEAVGFKAKTRPAPRMFVRNQSLTGQSFRSKFAKHLSPRCGAVRRFFSAVNAHFL